MTEILATLVPGDHISTKAFSLLEAAKEAYDETGADGFHRITPEHTLAYDVAVGRSRTEDSTPARLKMSIGIFFQLIFLPFRICKSRCIIVMYWSKPKYDHEIMILKTKYAH